MPGELEPVLPPPNLGAVPAQMSQIFAEAGAGEVAMGAPHAPRVSALRPGRGGPRPMTLLVAAAAGLVGLGAGAFVVRSPSQPAPAPSAQTQPAPPAAPAPVAALAPALQPIPPLAEAGPPLILAPAAAGKGPPHRVHHASRAHVTLAKALRVRRQPPPMAQPASCEKSATGSGCRRAVIQADRHLRDVYETAIRRGVPRAVLIDYRDRWADLRETDNKDPARLIERYGALAYDLGREAKDERESAARRRNPSGLKALASALAPWW